MNGNQAAKAELLRRLAERRKTGGGGIFGLQDSDDESAELTKRGIDEEENLVFNETRQAAKPFQRLKKGMSQAPVSHTNSSSQDDLVQQFGSMTVVPPSDRPMDGASGPASQLPNTNGICRRTDHMRQPLGALTVERPAIKADVASNHPQQAIHDTNSGVSEGVVLRLGEQNEFALRPEVGGKLYRHQVDGVKWLWGLWQIGRGGILADDM